MLCHAHLTSEPRSVKIALLSHAPKTSVGQPESNATDLCPSSATPHLFCDRHQRENACPYAPPRILPYVPRRPSPARACYLLFVLLPSWGDSLWDEQGASTDSLCPNLESRTAAWGTRSRSSRVVGLAHVSTHIFLLSYPIFVRNTGGHLDLVHRNGKQMAEQSC